MSCAQRLRPQVGRRVHEHAQAVVELDEDRRARRACRADRRSGTPRSRSRSSARRATCRCRETAHAQTWNASIQRCAAEETRDAQTRSIARAPNAPARARRARLRAARQDHGHAAIAATAARGIANRRTQSLRPFLLEETYEALDAIDRGDFDALTGELGDVLFQCVFHAQIAAEAGRFEIADAIESITDKLIRRHPHVFTASGRPLARGAARAARLRTPSAVHASSGSEIKAARAGRAGQEKRVLAGVPRVAAVAAARARDRHARARPSGSTGRTPPTSSTRSTRKCASCARRSPRVRRGPPKSSATCCSRWRNLARKLGIEPEAALRAANDKFTRALRRARSGVRARGPVASTARPPENWKPRGRRVKIVRWPPPTVIVQPRARSRPHPHARARRSRRRSRRRDRSGTVARRRVQPPRRPPARDDRTGCARPTLTSAICGR